MMLIGSKNNSKATRIYHRWNCIYAKKITEKNRDVICLKSREGNIECNCKYCGGFDGSVKVNLNKMQDIAKREHIVIYYDPNVQEMYVKTDVGFWKILYDSEYGDYILYHRNQFYRNIDFQEGIEGDFHWQGDIGTKSNFMSYLRYIVDHDFAKFLISADYRLLPRHTEKQQKYYEKARNKVNNRFNKKRYDYYNSQFVRYSHTAQA